MSIGKILNSLLLVTKSWTVAGAELLGLKKRFSLSDENLLLKLIKMTLQKIITFSGKSVIEFGFFEQLVPVLFSVDSSWKIYIGDLRLWLALETENLQV